MQQKRTKIVCTIGPASASPRMLLRMMQAGMDVARLNMSHGTHAEHHKLLQAIRKSAKSAGRTIGVLLDLQGPKMRVGALPDDGVVLHKGQLVHFTTNDKGYTADAPIPISYHQLHRDLRSGHRILFDDGTIEVAVERIRGALITARVKVPGTLKSHKGINVPDTMVNAETFTPKDRDDLLFGIAEGIDWVVLSFVATSDDLAMVRKVARAAAQSYGVRPPKIMAKVERRAALEHLEEIIDAADGILLGRGDLGVEIPPEEVPVVQKDVVEACRRAGKPVIVATQMLNSMVDNPRSTRAETSDVANAVFDHADAVMLSAESATGRYPAVAVQAMAAVIRQAEASHYDAIHDIAPQAPDYPIAIAQTVHMLARSRLIDGVVCVAANGAVARQVNMYRSAVPIFSVVPDDALARQLVLSSGVHPLVLSDEPGTLVSRVRTKIHREKLLARGARLAFVTGKAHEVGISLSL